MFAVSLTSSRRAALQSLRATASPSRTVFATLLQKQAPLGKFDAQEYDRVGLGRIEAVQPTSSARCMTSGSVPTKLAWPAKLIMASKPSLGMTSVRMKSAAASGVARSAKKAAAAEQLTSKLNFDLHGEEFAPGCWVP